MTKPQIRRMIILFDNPVENHHSVIFPYGFYYFCFENLKIVIWYLFRVSVFAFRILKEHSFLPDRSWPPSEGFTSQLTVLLFGIFGFDAIPFAGYFGQFFRVADIAFYIAALSAYEVIQCSNRSQTDRDGVAAEGTFF